MGIKNPQFVLEKLLAEMQAIQTSAFHSAEKKELASLVLEFAQKWDDDESRARLRGHHPIYTTPEAAL